jgi:hypothetical protein
MLYNPAINDFSKDARSVFFSMLNRELHTNYKVSDLYVSPAQSKTPTPDNNKNTMVELLPKGVTGNYGRLTFYYNRADIGALASKCRVIQSNNAVTLLDILPVINSKAVLNLLPGDIINAPFEMTQTGFKATLKPSIDNLLFTGSVDIQVIPTLPVPATSIDVNSVNKVDELKENSVAWFEITIPGDGVVSIDTFNSNNTDTVIAIYDNTGAKISDNDDCLTGQEPQASLIQLASLSIGKYYIAIALHDNFITTHNTNFNVSAAAANFKYSAIVNLNVSFTPNLI